jgi:hypothetical protein
VLSGDPDRSLVIARRKGRDWYVGGISSTDTLLYLTLPLDFTDGTAYAGQLWRDVPPVDPRAALRSFRYFTQDSTPAREQFSTAFDPNRLIKSRVTAPGTALTIPVAPGGGFVVHLTAQDKTALPR